MVMSDENDQIASRRKVIKSIGVVGGTSLASGLSSAESKDKTQVKVGKGKVSEILSKDKVRAVQNEVGGIEVNKREGIKFTDSEGTTAYSIKTNVGELFYSEKDGESEAGISLGLSLRDGEEVVVSSEEKEKLNPQYRSLSYESPVMSAINNEGSWMHKRIATPTETTYISNKLNIPKQYLTPVISEADSEMVIFSSYEGSKRAKSIYYLSQVPEEAPYTELSEDQVMNLEEVYFFSTENTCNDMLGTCAASNGATAACVMGCVSVGAFTVGLAFAACAICSGGTSFNAGIQCGQWFKRCV